MATKVIMPQLGESVVEGTVTRWLKQPGDDVKEFEPLVEINTDKVDTEVPSPASGVVLKLYVDEGETVEAGRLLAVIGKAGETAPEGAGEVTQNVQAAPAKAAAVASPKAGKSEDLGFISPVVARMAAEHHLDLTQIEGTGRGGRITKKDVQAFIETGGGAASGSAPAPWEEPASGELFRPSEEIFGPASGWRGGEKQGKPGDVEPLGPVRKAIAEHMLRSKQTSPHVTTVMEADLSRVVAHRQAHVAEFERDGVRLTFSAYFAAAAVQALKAVPIANASLTEGGIQYHGQVNLGIAVSLGEEGLIVPVIKNADQFSLRGLAAALDDLAGRARGHQLKPEEVQGGTFTITNHGVTGSLMATPIINQPQSGILGVGAIQKRVVVVESEAPSGGRADGIAIRPMVYLTLTFDHRIMDGAIGDTFLGHVVKTLEAWG
jgi:pyruvate/2-oxoglutarate dehydrogenase complex dihydrolipoamide acyltransferase (E2) component